MPYLTKLVEGVKPSESGYFCTPQIHTAMTVDVMVLLLRWSSTSNLWYLSLTFRIGKGAPLSRSVTQLHQVAISVLHFPNHIKSSLCCSWLFSSASLIFFHSSIPSLSVFLGLLNTFHLSHDFLHSTLLTPCHSSLCIISVPPPLISFSYSCCTNVNFLAYIILIME